MDNKTYNAEVDNNCYGSGQDTSKTSGMFGYQCPVCWQHFQDIHTYAAHVTGHSENEKKRKAEDEKKRREVERKADIEKLELLYADKRDAEVAFEKGMEEYRKKYGGLSFHYRSLTPDLASFFEAFF